MNFELTYFTQDGGLADSVSSDWQHKGNTWAHKKLGFRFDCIEREDGIEIPAGSIHEEKGNRIHAIIPDPGRISLSEGGGSLLLPLDLGVLCHCRNKPSAEVRLPLFNVCGSVGSMSMLAALHKNGRVRMVVAEDGRFDANIRLRTAFGGRKVYSADFEFVLREYPDTLLQCGVSLFFMDFTGGIAEIADHYRKYVFARRGVLRLEEKMKHNPALERSARSIMVRMRLAVKEVGALAEQTPDLQPGMFVFMTFPMVGKIVSEFKRQKIGNIDFNLVGWNYGGHDGAYPQVFPVEERLGGEEALRKLLADAQKAGYSISIHDNYFDMYPIAENFNLENAARKHDGTPLMGDVWGGGRAFQICAERAYMDYYLRNRKQISKLPLNGAYYIDVLGCAQLTPCYSKQHPETRSDNAFWWKKILGDAQKQYHVTMSEGIREWAMPETDRSYSICVSPGVRPIKTKDGDTLKLFDQEVGLFPMVYHDCVLYNTYRKSVNAFPGEDNYLLNIVMGGIPLFYYYKRFIGKMWDDKLHYTTPERIRREVGLIGKASSDMKRLSGLTTRRIVNIIRHSDSVWETVYDNGTRVAVNLSGKTVRLEPGFSIPPHDFTVRKTMCKNSCSSGRFFLP